MHGDVLIIDDEPERLAGVVRLLQAAGYGVALAGSGAEGLERVRDELPDLILVDFMLPWMDGFEVLRRAAT
jgi:CheY-like chemotaxis protein